MPEFPDQFTAATSVALTDYVFVNQTKATVAQLGAALGTYPLAAWNGTDVAQFGSANNIGTPAGPALSLTTPAAGPSSAIRLLLGAGTGAGEGAVWYMSTAVPFDSLRIRFSVGFDVANIIAPGETMTAGVVFGADQTAGTGYALGVTINDLGAGTLVLLTKDNYTTVNATAATFAVSGAYFFSVDCIFRGALFGAAGAPPNGMPLCQGLVSASGITGSAISGSGFATTTADFLAAIGANDTDSVGVFASSTTGVAANTALLMYDLSFEANP